MGSTVELKIHTTDLYGRTVAEILSSGRNINQAMVGQGMAFVYWNYIKRSDRNTYAAFERQATSQRLGAWGPLLEYDLMLPWDYRACRKAKQCS